MNVIQRYASINDNNNDDKDQFYKRLQSILAKCSGIRLTILKGNLNRRVGMDSNGQEDIMGRNGLKEGNGNGKLFTKLCVFNKLVFGGTIFLHNTLS